MARSSVLKGITIEFDANTTKLSKALDGFDDDTKRVNKELSLTRGLLKFNPGNTEIVAQKQTLLAKNIKITSDRLSMLKTVQSQVEAQFASGDLGEEEYRAFQREVVATEGRLKHYQSELKNSQTEQDELGQNTRQLDAYFEASGKSIDDYADVLGPALTSAMKEGRASSTQLETAINKIGKTSTESREDFDKFKAALKKVDDGGSIDELKTDLASIRPEAQRSAEALDNIASNTFTEKLQNIGDAFGNIGDKAKDIADSTIDAWSEMDDAVDNLTSKTGATGAAAESLGSSYEKVEGSMAGSQMEASDLSDTMAGLNSVFGLTGGRLESTSEYVAKFSAVTGQSGTEAVDALRNTLGKFNVQAKDIPGVLDSLASASQTSGVSVGDLESQVADAYPVFSQLHIGLQQGIGIVGQWAKGGVDASTALKGMQKASATYAAGNKTLSQGLTETFGKIKDAKSPVDALNAGVEAFGTRQAPAMVAAIQSGKVSLEDLQKASTDSTGKVKKSFEQTLDPIDDVNLAQKKMKQSLAEVGGEILSSVAPAMQKMVDFAKMATEAFTHLPDSMKSLIVIGGAIAVALGVVIPVVTSIITAFSAIGPALSAIGGVLTSVGAVFGLTLGPVIAIIAGVVAAVIAVIAVIKNWGAIVGWLQTVWGAVSGFFQGMWNGIVNVFTTAINWIGSFIQTGWGQALMFLVNPIAGIVNLIVQHFDQIKSVIMTVLTVVGSFISNTWNGIKTVTANVWNGITSSISNFVNGIKNTVTNVWNGIKNVTSSVWNGIKNAIMTPINAAKSAVQNVINAIKGFFNFHISWPHIPLPHFGIKPSGWQIGDLLKGSIPSLAIDWHAAGGIFNKPTLFQSGGGLHGVGEAGPEAVLPLNAETLAGIGAGIAATMSNSGQDSANILARILMWLQNGGLGDEISENAPRFPSQRDFVRDVRKALDA